MKTLHTLFLTLCTFLFWQGLHADTKDTRSEVTTVYTFAIQSEIGPPALRTTQKAFRQARAEGADLVVLQLNTYGGLLDAADSIRTIIMNSEIPVYVFIDNNAASAGALISIACDSIYMRKGANIGAASVVNQQGEVMPDKYQSYMRSIMRSTAEAQGRDPDIAQAMVDPDIYIKEVSDSGKVLTFTTAEAIKNGFCEGQAETIHELLVLAGVKQYKLLKQRLTRLDKLIGFLISPAISGILIMIIVGGIYFELQTPGVGFPLAAALAAATLYFAPLYLEDLAANWEILLFVAGVILIAVEIFVIPGFGVAGISGISFVLAGLTLSLVRNSGFDFSYVPSAAIMNAFILVILSMFISLLGSFFAGKQLLVNTNLGHIALDAQQNKSDGYTVARHEFTEMIGKQGVAATMLRPVGHVIVEGNYFPARAVTGYIEKGENILVTDYENTELIVEKAD